MRQWSLPGFSLVKSTPTPSQNNDVGMLNGWPCRSPSFLLFLAVGPSDPERIQREFIDFKQKVMGTELIGWLMALHTFHDFAMLFRSRRCFQNPLLIPSMDTC